jgi:hypothetical protein
VSGVMRHVHGLKSNEKSVQLSDVMHNTATHVKMYSKISLHSKKVVISIGRKLRNCLLFYAITNAPDVNRMNHLPRITLL